MEKIYDSTVLLTVEAGDYTVDNTSATGSIILQLGTDDDETIFEVKNDTGGTLFSVDGIGVVEISSTLAVDTIVEGAGAAGVTVGGIKIENKIITPVTPNFGAFIDLSGMLTGEADITLADNVASAFEVRQFSISYLVFDTTTNSEAIHFGIGGQTIDYDFRGTGSVFLEDNLDFNIGTDGLKIVFDGSNTVMTSTGGDLIIDNDNGTGFTIMTLGSINSATGFQVKNASATTMFAVNGNGAVEMPDSTTLSIGTSLDLRFQHTAGNSIITSKTGNLTIDNTNATGSTIMKLGTNDDDTDFQVQNASAIALLTIDADRLEVTVPLDASQGMARMDRLEYYEDFLGPAGTSLPAPWVIQDTSSSGAPTLDYVSGARNGVFELEHDSTSEQQNLTLYWGNSLHIDATSNAIFEARVKINFAGANFSADQRVVIGMAAARNATLDDITAHAWFRIDGADLNIDVETDDNTTDTSEDSNFNIIDNAWTVFRIDLTDPSDIRFFINGVETTETGPMSAPLIGGKWQPFIELQRDAGVEVENVQIDYVQIICDR